jgi:hypothetical protein
MFRKSHGIGMESLHLEFGLDISKAFKKPVGPNVFVRNRIPNPLRPLGFSRL